MIFALIVVLGIFSFFRIGVELLPEVDSPYISVIVSYPGASTESVEQQVTKPIEDVLSSISHFKQVRSATRPGRAEIFVELDSNADADLVAIERLVLFVKNYRMILTNLWLLNVHLMNILLWK